MRLRRSVLTGPGVRRVRRGRGFAFVDASGRAVDAETRARARALAIPPAWRDVWVCPYPNGHIQAVGTDDAGRRQYLYHPAWREARDQAKHERVQRLAPRLADMRTRVQRDLQRSGHGRDRVVAVALRMLDLGLFRTGGEEYEQENGSHGVATLHREHVTVRGDDIHFRFPAKSGVERDATVTDPQLASAVRALRRSRAPGERLLQYRDAAGWHDLTSADVNAAFKALTGTDCTVKDLRTWSATVTAAAALAELTTRSTAGAPTPRAARRPSALQIEREVLRLVAAQLGNTPAVARRSYVDPVVLEQHAAGTTLATAGRLFRSLSGADHARILRGEPLSVSGRHTLERAVLRLLRTGAAGV